MPLPEVRRSQLDSIVGRMEAARESDDEIRAVVADFKSKYEPKAKPTGTAEDPFTDVRQLTDRYPDNPEASRLFNNPTNQAKDVQAGQREAYQSQPFNDRANAGFGRFAYGFVPGKKAGGEREAFDQASAGDFPTLAGRLAPEIALASAGGSALAGATRAASAAGAARIASPVLQAGANAGAQGAAYGVPSVGLHQLQNVTEGRGLDPKAAAAEMILSTLLPAAGGAGGQWMRQQGPEVLRTAVKPLLDKMDTPNPPNFQAALENDLVPAFGGLERSQERARALIQEVGGRRDVAARAASSLPGSPTPTVRVPFVRGALQDAENDLARQMQNPRTQLLTHDHDEARNALAFWEREFAQRSTSRGGNMSVEDALGFRQRIDDEINWRAVNQATTPGFDLASSSLRRSLNERIAQAAPEVGATTRQLADVVPYEGALRRRNLQAGNNYKLGLLDMGALTAGGTLGGLSGYSQDATGPGAALGALGLLGTRRLFSTPGGAAMLFGSGRSLTNPSNLRDVVTQALRSGGNEAFGSFARERRRQASLDRALSGQIDLNAPPSEDEAAGMDSTLQDGIRRGLLQLGPVMSGN